jgi:hypothetical protein
MTARRTQVFASLFVLLLASRLCHSDILWTDGDYHLAAALQVLHGKALYRDLWYDKPPLNALLFAAFGAPTGWMLSVLEAVWVFVACVFAYLAAKTIGGEKAGLGAAALLAFFLIFYLPAAVIGLAPDLIMVVPHLAAIYFALSKKPLAAGLCAGIAFWANTKALFVLLACAVIVPSQILPLSAGFLLPALPALAALEMTGSLPGYIEQVWRWGVRYAANSPHPSPVLTGVTHTANWLGFHAALVLGAGLYWARERSRIALRLALWTAISFAGVCLGLRFVPRYYFEFLAPMVVIAALGLFGEASIKPRWAMQLLTALLLIPALRFGPRYLQLAWDDVKHQPHHWSDIALDQDDRRLAQNIAAGKQSGDTLFVWGYRPGLYVYTGMSSPSVFWDSQPLDGVPADRHLESSTPVAPHDAQRNREIFAKTQPTFVVDALSQFNPALSIQRFPDLAPWFAQYELAGGTPLSPIYRLKKH